MIRCCIRRKSNLKYCYSHVRPETFGQFYKRKLVTIFSSSNQQEPTEKTPISNMLSSVKRCNIFFDSKYFENISLFLQFLRCGSGKIFQHATKSFLCCWKWFEEDDRTEMERAMDDLCPSLSYEQVPFTWRIFPTHFNFQVYKTFGLSPKHWKWPTTKIQIWTNMTHTFFTNVWRTSQPKTLKVLVLSILLDSPSFKYDTCFSF